MGSRGVNKVIIVGNLGQDPETKYMPSGGAATNVSVATSESWKDKNTGEQQERTEWHRVVFFNRLAEIAGEYLRKGSKVYIEGSLRTRKWQGQDGSDRYTTEIVASEMHMLDSRSEGASQGVIPQQPQQVQPQAQAQKINQQIQQQVQQMQPQPVHNGGQQVRRAPTLAQQQAHQQMAQGQEQFDDGIPF